MAIELTKEIKELFEDPQSIKVLATTGRDGNLNVVFKQSLRINEQGYIEYKELIETSQTNKNMVYSIWFHKLVSVNIRNGNKSYQIKGYPYRSLIAGREFEAAYREVQEKHGKIDLSAVWRIEPVEIREETFDKRRVEEEEEHPILKHLDRLIVQN